MNRSAVSADHQGDPNWGGSDNWVDHPTGFQAFESQQYPSSRTLDWDWENAMLLSQQPTEDDAQDRRIRAGMMRLTPIYNGIDIPTALPTATFSQHSLSHVNTAGLRNFVTMVDGSSSFPSSTSPALLESSLGSSSGLSVLPSSTLLRESAIDHRRRLFGILSLQDPKNHQLTDVVKREPEFCSGDSAGNTRIGLNLGVRTYFSNEDTAAGRTGKRLRGSCSGAQVPVCQAEGCKADLRTAKNYHRRHKVCDLHSKAPTVIANGQSQRFCQQCSRFHLLSEFDDGKRSCRKRLADHNRRRRKPQSTSTSAGVTNAEMLDAVQKEHQGHPGGVRTVGTASQASIDSALDGQLSAISLCSPVTLMNAKRELPALPGNMQEAVFRYLHGVGQTGTHLSLSTTGAGIVGLQARSRQNVNERQDDIEPSSSWLRTGTGSRSDVSNTHIIHPSSVQQLRLNNYTEASHGSSGTNSVAPQAFVSSIQNLMPLQSSSDISSSDWLLGREPVPEQFSISMPRSTDQRHRVRLSPLDASTSVRTVPTETQRSAVEFLRQQPTLTSNTGDDSQSRSVHQSDMKFPDLEALRPFVSTIYSSNRDMS